MRAGWPIGLGLVAILLTAGCGAPSDAPAEPSAKVPATPAPAASGPMKNGADAAAASVPTSIGCGGPFVREATPATLAAVFGRENVIPETVAGPEAQPLNVTAIYPKDKQRRIEVTFENEEERTGLTSATVLGDTSLWDGPGGLRLGDTVEKVEAANGAAFLLSGFGWDYGGFVTDWKGGKLDGKGGCHTTVRFGPQEVAGDDVSGERKLLSSDPKVRAAGARVVEFGVAPAK